MNSLERQIVGSSARCRCYAEIWFLAAEAVFLVGLLVAVLCAPEKSSNNGDSVTRRYQSYGK